MARRWMDIIRYSESQAQELAPYLVTDPVTPLLQSYLDRIDLTERRTIDFQKYGRTFLVGVNYRF